jgi:hypothetical protein
MEEPRALPVGLHDVRSLVLCEKFIDQSIVLKKPFKRFNDHTGFMVLPLTLSLSPTPACR